MLSEIAEKLTLKPLSACLSCGEPSVCSPRPPTAAPGKICPEITGRPSWKPANSTWAALTRPSR